MERHLPPPHNPPPCLRGPYDVPDLMIYEDHEGVWTTNFCCARLVMKLQVIGERETVKTLLTRSTPPPSFSASSKVIMKIRGPVSDPTRILLATFARKWSSFCTIQASRKRQPGIVVPSESLHRRYRNRDRLNLNQGKEGFEQESFSVHGVLQTPDSELLHIV